jgi:adenylate cyclase
MAYLVGALAVLGEVERAKAWAERAMLLDPDNFNMRYNIACSLIIDLAEHEAALDLLEPGLAASGIEALNWVKTDTDLDAVRHHPRFKAMVAAAEARLGQA